MGEPTPQLCQTGQTGDRRRLFRCRFIPVVAFALVAVSLVPSAAAQDRPIMLRLDTSMMWDANVFRVPDSAPDPQLARGIPGKSDRITTTTLGVHIDKPYAQQRFQLDVSQTATRYASFTPLNRDAFQYNGGWLWSLTPRISGSFTVDHSESLIPFTDLTTTQPNFRTNDNRAFNLDGWMFGGWHLLLGAANAKSKNSQTNLAAPSYESNSGEVGLTYASESGNTVTATTRSTRGTNSDAGLPDLINFIDSEFRVQERELKTTWKASGKSTLNGRLTRLERRNEHVSQRDFSATTGELGYTWDVGGRLLLNFSATRSALPWTQDTQASYRIDDRLSFTPSLKVSDKVNLRINAYRLVSDFRGPIVPVTGPLRHDILRSAQLAVDWTPPLRNVLLTASVQRDRRSSSTTGFDFNDTMAMFSASLKF